MSTFRDKAMFYPSVALLNVAVLIGVIMPSMLPLDQPPVASAASVEPQAPVSSQAKNLTEASGKPIRIVVEDLGLDLNVADGFYSNASGTWTLSNTKAYYATPTVPANTNSGMTLIYGHDIEAIFGRLHQLAPGANLSVYTDNGQLYRYSYSSVKEVAPGAVQEIRSDGLPTAVLQTCSGNWSEKRALFYFKLVSVEKHG